MFTLSKGHEFTDQEAQCLSVLIGNNTEAEAVPTSFLIDGNNIYIFFKGARLSGESLSVPQIKSPRWKNMVGELFPELGNHTFHFISEKDRPTAEKTLLLQATTGIKVEGLIGPIEVSRSIVNRLLGHHLFTLKFGVQRSAHPDSVEGGVRACISASLLRLVEKCNIRKNNPRRNGGVVTHGEDSRLLAG